MALTRIWHAALSAKVISFTASGWVMLSSTVQKLHYLSLCDLDDYFFLTTAHFSFMCLSPKQPQSSLLARALHSTLQ